MRWGMEPGSRLPFAIRPIIAAPVPLSISFGLLLAIMLSWNVRGQAIYRTLFYLPAVIPIVAASVLWLWLLDPADGMVNYLLGWIGLADQNWLTQARSAVSQEGLETVRGWAKGENVLALFGARDAMILMSVWAVGNAMIIFLAAIGDVPQSLYEAATIDGAGWWSKFRHVTLPMLSPVILFNLIMGLIRSVQMFASVYVLSEGTGNQVIHFCFFHSICSCRRFRIWKWATHQRWPGSFLCCWSSRPCYCFVRHDTGSTTVMWRESRIPVGESI